MSSTHDHDDSIEVISCPAHDIPNDNDSLCVHIPRDSPPPRSSSSHNRSALIRPDTISGIENSVSCNNTFCSNGNLAGHPLGSVNETCLLSPAARLMIAQREERTPKDKRMARMIGFIAGVLILASFVLVGVTLSMSEHIDEMVRKMSSTTPKPEVPPPKPKENIYNVTRIKL